MLKKYIRWNKLNWKYWRYNIYELVQLFINYKFLHETHRKWDDKMGPNISEFSDLKCYKMSMSKKVGKFKK